VEKPANSYSFLLKIEVALNQLPVFVTLRMRSKTSAIPLRCAKMMDFVISVDTSVVHLGGALGRPTWVLLPYVPNWRWLLDQDDSPRYPSIRLYRQASDGDWDGVLGRVRDDLVLLGIRTTR
jgi:ADP-heptose:LPS heptosyltransferase